MWINTCTVFFEAGDKREGNKIKRIRVKAVLSFYHLPHSMTLNVCSTPTLAILEVCFLEGITQMVSGQRDTKGS